MFNYSQIDQREKLGSTLETSDESSPSNRGLDDRWFGGNWGLMNLDALAGARGQHSRRDAPRRSRNKTSLGVIAAVEGEEEEEEEEEKEEQEEKERRQGRQGRKGRQGREGRGGGVGRGGVGAGGVLRS